MPFHLQFPKVTTGNSSKLKFPKVISFQRGSCEYTKDLDINEIKRLPKENKDLRRTIDDQEELIGEIAQRAYELELQVASERGQRQGFQRGATLAASIAIEAQKHLILYGLQQRQSEQRQLEGPRGRASTIASSDSSRHNPSVKRSGSALASNAGSNQATHSSAKPLHIEHSEKSGSNRTNQSSAVNPPSSNHASNAGSHRSNDQSVKLPSSLRGETSGSSRTQQWLAQTSAPSEAGRSDASQTSHRSSQLGSTQSQHVGQTPSPSEANRSTGSHHSRRSAQHGTTRSPRYDGSTDLPSRPVRSTGDHSSHRSSNHGSTRSPQCDGDTPSPSEAGRSSSGHCSRRSSQESTRSSHNSAETPSPSGAARSTGSHTSYPSSYHGSTLSTRHSAKSVASSTRDNQQTRQSPRSLLVPSQYEGSRHSSAHGPSTSEARSPRQQSRSFSTQEREIAAAIAVREAGRDVPNPTRSLRDNNSASGARDTSRHVSNSTRTQSPRSASVLSKESWETSRSEREDSFRDGYRVGEAQAEHDSRMDREKGYQRSTAQRRGYYERDGRE